MGILLSSIVQFVKVALEEEPKPEYQPITQVYAFPRGSFDCSRYCTTPKRQAMTQSYIDEKKEIKRLQRKHWFERLCGTSNEEIYAKYGRDQFGKIKG